MIINESAAKMLGYTSPHAAVGRRFDQWGRTGQIATVRDQWKKTIPNRPFEYSFLDEAFDRNYKSEIRFGRIFINFSILAIFISSLGLLGLAAYSTTQRTKEIGVRKVLGASVASITRLLSADFVRLVFLAFLIASPIAWFAMNSWLHNFAYRTTIAWWVFLLAGGASLLIVILTISWQAIKAAIQNPIKSLRTE